jgi:pyrimidine operon attenuation protein / uracil phosphoribosyltransferase
MTTRSVGRPVEIHQKAQLMSASEVERTLIRLAHEILEKNNGCEDLALVGIRRRGVPLAERLAKIVQRIEKQPVPVGTLDITLYRDDLSTLDSKPVVQKSDLGIPVAGKSVVLVDDVLYTGRTTRAAMDALFREGRPKRLQLCVLIDRGHRELPIEAAFVGRVVQTTENQIIEVKLREVDDAEKVLLMEKGYRSGSQFSYECSAWFFARHRASGSGRDSSNTESGAADESGPATAITARTTGPAAVL